MSRKRRHRKLRDVRRLAKRPNFTALLHHYDPFSLLTAVSAAAAYPANSPHLMHFDYLVAAVWSLKPPYGDAPVDHAGLAAVLATIPSKARRAFALAEDFVPCDNLDDVRCLYRGELLRFFFGALERPLAEVERLSRELTLFDDMFSSVLGFSSEDALDWTLRYHDHLLSGLSRWDRRHTLDRPTDVSVRPIAPPDEFLDYWRSLIPIHEDSVLALIDKGRHERVSRWLALESSTIGAGEPLADLYATPLSSKEFLRFGTRVVAPLPQFAIDRLYATFTPVLQKTDQETRHRLRSATLRWARDACNQLFSGLTSHLVLEKAEIRGSNDTTVYLPILVLFDTDKVFLFDIVTAVLGEVDVQPTFDAAQERLEKAKGILASDPQPHVRGYYRGAAGHVAIDSSVEVICFVVMNRMGLESPPVSVSIRSDGIFEVISLLDLIALSRASPDSMTFMKYLRDRERLNAEVPAVMSIDYLDAFAYYLDNGCTFLRGATTPTGLLFAPHSWSDYEHEQLRSRAELRALLAEERIPERVQVETRNNHQHQIYDPLSDMGAVVLIAPNGQRLTVHVIMPGITREEIQLNEYISQVLTYHVERSGNLLWNLLEECGFRGRSVKILPHLDESVRKHVLEEAWLRALDERPDDLVVALAYPGMPPSTTVVALIYRRALAEEAQADLNSAERRIFRELVTAIVLYAGSGSNRSDPSKVASELTDALVPVGPPLINLHQFALPQATIGIGEPTPESRADMSRVQLEIARHLKMAGVAPGTYRDAAASGLANQTVYPFLQSLLEQEVSKYSVSDLVLRTYKELEQVESRRHIRRRQLERDAATLPLTYDPASALSRHEADIASAASALRLLLEYIVKIAPAGTHRLSVEGWLRLRAICVSMFRTVMTSEAIHYHLKQSAITVGDDFQLTDETEGEDLLDLDAFTRSQSKQNLLQDAGRNNFSAAKQMAYGNDTNPQGWSVLETDSALEPVNAALERQFGYGLDDLFGVLLGLEAYPIGEHDEDAPVVVVEPDQLVDRLVGLVQGLERNTVRKVLPDLVLTHEDLKADAIEPWRLRDLRYRVVTRPIIEIGSGGLSKLTFGTWTASSTLAVWLRYLRMGEVPLPAESLDDSVTDTLEDYRESRNKNLEDEMIETLEKISRHVLRNIPSSSLPTLFGEAPSEDPGEIDALFADTRTRVLWVLDAKDLSDAISPREIVSQYRHFLEQGKKSYTYKLSKKVQYIVNVMPAALHTLGVADTCNWRTQAAFVTRGIIPTAFARDLPYPIISLRSLFEDLHDAVHDERPT